MCPGNFTRGLKGYITRTLWEKLIDEIIDADPGAIVLPFWRGESLLHPDFTGFMEYALSKSVRIHISTNGHVMTESQMKILASCEFVTFSIHSARGLSNAGRFLSFKKHGHPLVQLSFVKGEKTTGKFLPSLVSAPNLEGFDSIRLYEEHTRDGVFGKSSISPKGAQRVFCKKLLDTLVIAYDGSVSRCNHIWRTDTAINLHKVSISEVWSSDLLKKIRDNYPDDRCGQCDQWIGHTLGESWRIIEGKLEHNIYSAHSVK